MPNSIDQRHIELGDTLVVYRKSEGGYQLAWESPDGRTYVDHISAPFGLEKWARNNAMRKYGLSNPVRRSY